MIYKFHHTSSKYQYVNMIVDGFNLISNHGFKEVYFIFDTYRAISIDKQKIFDYKNAFIQRLSIQDSFIGSTLTEYGVKSNRWCAIAFSDNSIYLYNLCYNERVQNALNIKSIIARISSTQNCWIPYLCSRRKRLNIRDTLNRYLDLICTQEDINKLANLSFSSEWYSPVVNTIKDLDNINPKYLYYGTIIHVKEEGCNYVYNGNTWMRVYRVDSDMLFYDNKPHVVFNDIKENNIILNIIQNTINNNTEVK